MNTSRTRTKLVGAVIAGVAIATGAACALQTSDPHGTSTVDYSLISTSTTPTPSVMTLSPNDDGYVRVETKSGLTRSSLNAELVACQTSAGNWPRGADGQPFHVASVTPDGQFHWVKADLGLLEGIVTMDYQIYSAQGWTIVATDAGTTFTNDRTGHGMSVSTEAVQPF